MTQVREQVVDYYELEAELAKIKADASPEEAHGILCGELCGGNVLEGIMWLKHFLPDIGVKREPWDDTRDWFYALRTFVLEDLQSPEFDFTPLLPDDEEPLTKRLHAIGAWCSGFLAGFGGEGERDEKAFSKDIRAAFRDLAAISQIDTDFDGEPEQEDERNFFEVLEYVRMAALMVFTEFALVHQSAPEHANNTSEPPTLH